jgi:hypothetical protein
MTYENLDYSDPYSAVDIMLYRWLFVLNDKALDMIITWRKSKESLVGFARLLPEGVASNAENRKRIHSSIRRLAVTCVENIKRDYKVVSDSTAGRNHTTFTSEEHQSELKQIVQKHVRLLLPPP